MVFLGGGGGGGGVGGGRGVGVGGGGGGGWGGGGGGLGVGAGAQLMARFMGHNIHSIFLRVSVYYLILQLVAEHTFTTCNIYIYICIYILQLFYSTSQYKSTWWRHQMETFSALLALCAGNSLAPGELSPQRPVTRSSDVLFNLRLNKRLNKHSRRLLFESHLVHHDVTVMDEGNGLAFLSDRKSRSNVPPGLLQLLVNHICMNFHLKVLLSPG